MSEEISSYLKWSNSSVELDDGNDSEGSDLEEAADFWDDLRDALSSTSSLDSDSATSDLYQLDVLVGDDDRSITCSADVFSDVNHSFISRDLAVRLGLRMIPLAPSPMTKTIPVPIYGSIRMESFVAIKARIPSISDEAVTLNIGVIDVEKRRVEHFVLGFEALQKISITGKIPDLHKKLRRRHTMKVVAGVYQRAGKWVAEINDGLASQSSLHSAGSDHSNLSYLTSNADELILGTESSVLYEPDIEKGRLLALLSELDHCAPTQCELDDTVTISWCDRSKLALECVSGCHWDWWPLSSPRRPLKSDEIRLVWTCGCGDIRSENLPTILGQKLIRLLNERGMSGGAPGTPVLPNGRDQSQGIIHPAEPHTGVKAVARDIASQDRFPQVIMHDNSISGYKSTERFIFLMVTSSSLQLNQIESTKECTRTFAADLRDGYRQLRGFWKYWFSVYVFSHCDFFEFEKFGTSLFTDIGEGLPPEAVVPEYSYYPRPAEGPRPISPKEFQHIYYHHRQDSNIHDSNSNKPFDSTVNQVRSCLEPLKAWIPTLKRRYRGPLPADTVPRIPKRCSRFDELSNVRERFWGLHAREAVSAIRLTIYLFWCMASCFAFCLWYLVGFGGDAIDLQNATVPLMVALTMVNLSFIWMTKN